LRQELEDSKAEIARLRERLATALPPIHKDLSLISIVPKWSCAESDTPVEDFLASIERAAKIARWNGTDCLRIATLRLTDPARAFYKSSHEVQAEDATWEGFKLAFQNRFKDAHTDQYHFLKLLRAKQGKTEGPQEFADRCKNLAQKVMFKVNDPVAQRIHKENADRMCLASYVSGLSANVGKMVRIQNPQTLQQALTNALAVTEAERQEKGNEIFFTGSDKPSDRKDHKNVKTEQNFDARAGRNKSSHSSAGRAKSGTTLRCYECDGRDHFGLE